MEARKGKWGLLFQPNYLTVSADGDFGEGGNISVDVELEAWIVEFGGSYRALSWGGERGFLDVILGGRYWNFSAEVDAKNRDDGSAEDMSSDTDIVDPFAGIRFGSRLTDALQLRVRCDIGGFDLSSDTSDFSWQAMALFGYDLSQRSTVFAGYRALGLDYDERVLEKKLEMAIRTIRKFLVVQKMDSDHRLELVLILSRTQLFHVELAQVEQGPLGIGRVFSHLHLDIELFPGFVLGAYVEKDEFFPYVFRDNSGVFHPDGPYPSVFRTSKDAVYQIGEDFDVSFEEHFEYDVGFRR